MTLRLYLKCSGIDSLSLEGKHTLFYIKKKKHWYFFPKNSKEKQRMKKCKLYSLHGSIVLIPWNHFLCSVTCASLVPSLERNIHLDYLFAIKPASPKEKNWYLVSSTGISTRFWLGLVTTTVFHLWPHSVLLIASTQWSYCLYFVPLQTVRVS